MNRSLNLVAAAAMVASGALATPAIAQPPPGTYWTGDICHAAQAHEARRGTRIGAIAGGVLGAAVTRNRVAGALIGGTAGAVAGSAIGRSQVRCVAPPPRFRSRRNCQWVQDHFHGRWHTFEVCRHHDGVWRPSGR